MSVVRSRLRWLVLLAGAACSQGESIATSGAFTTLGPGSETTSEGDDTTGSPPGETLGTTDPSSPPTTAASASVTTDVDDTSSSSVEPTSATDVDTTPPTTTGLSDTSGEDSTGAMLPPQPVDGWWEHCTNDTCPEAPMVCLGDGMLDGVCTGRCTPAGNTASCEALPGITAVPICLTLSVNGVTESICALDCSDGKTCAQGMVCVADSDDVGPFEICL